MPVFEQIAHQTVEGIRVGRVNKGINTTFIVYRIGNTVIDAGPSVQRKEVLDYLSNKEVSRLLITHHHEDHSGNAFAISRQKQITPYARPLSASILKSGYRIPPIQKYIWGAMDPLITQPMPDVLFTDDGLLIESVFTPGHSFDMHCYFLPNEGALFTGDLYVSKGLKFMLKEEDLGQLMSSIYSVLKKDFLTIYCPHNGVVTNGKQALATKLDNLISICEQTQYLKNKGLDAKEIKKQILGKETWLSVLSLGNITKQNLIDKAMAVDLSGFMKNHSLEVISETYNG